MNLCIRQCTNEILLSHAGVHHMENSGGFLLTFTMCGRQTDCLWFQIKHESLLSLPVWSAPPGPMVKKHSSAQEWEFLLVWLTSLLFTFFYGYKFFKILCFFLCYITELRVIMFGHKNSSGKSPNGNLGKYRLENPFSCLSSKGEIGATDGVCCVEGTSQKAASLLQQLFCKNLRGCPTLPKKWGVPAASLFNIRAQRDFTASTVRLHKAPAVGPANMSPSGDVLTSALTLSLSALISMHSFPQIWELFSLCATTWTQVGKTREK